MNIVTDPKAHYYGYTLPEIACMRALYPAKRDLAFNRKSVDYLIRWFKTTYPTADKASLPALCVPSSGDRTWVGMALGLGPLPADGESLED
jgi:hypothetical protein